MINRTGKGNAAEGKTATEMARWANALSDFEVNRRLADYLPPRKRVDGKLLRGNPVNYAGNLDKCHEYFEEAFGDDPNGAARVDYWLIGICRAKGNRMAAWANAPERARAMLCARMERGDEPIARRGYRGRTDGYKLKGGGKGK